MKWSNFLLAITFLFSGCFNKAKETLLIATAANMQFAMAELGEKFSNETGIGYELIIGSSGKLTAQIKEGAPYDLFLSADTRYTHELTERGLTATPPKVYAFGKLILWTMNKDIPLSMDSLTDSKIKHIALANPKTAPYGAAALEIIELLGYQEPVKEKFVFGESIGQTNQFIISGAADIGFTALSVVKSTTVKNKGYWKELDKKLYSPIKQSAVLLKTDKAAAEAFYAFLFSAKAQEILKDHGYLVNE